MIFVTNCLRNDGYLAPLADLPVKIFHLEDLVQHLIDDLDATMPRTPNLMLNDIHTVLSADKRDTSVSTSIVFARLVDSRGSQVAIDNCCLFLRETKDRLGS